MIINILRYSLFVIAGGQKVDRNFCIGLIFKISCKNRKIASNFKSFKKQRHPLNR